MHYCFLRFPGNRKKAFTVSFDDGCRTDRPLVELLDQYGMKGTFNLTGYCIKGGRDFLTPDEMKKLYVNGGHEVAVHGENHRALCNISSAEGIAEVMNGRRALEDFFGGIIRGYAYADRIAVDDATRNFLSMLNIAYARVTAKTGNFALPKAWYDWQPTCKHDDPELLPLADRFLSDDPDKKYCAMRDPMLFYVWGHSSELMGKEKEFKRFCEKISGHDEVWYATNIELYDYINAYRLLRFNLARDKVYNPTLIPVCFDVDGHPFTVAPGETKVLTV